MSLIAVVVVIAVSAGIEYAFVAIPSQTALQEELPVGVRGRIFGILNTLLSVASFLPVLIAPVAADLINLVFKGAGIPVVMAVLGALTLWIGIASWRHNAAAGLHAGGTASRAHRGGRGCAVGSWPEPSWSRRGSSPGSPSAPGRRHGCCRARSACPCCTSPIWPGAAGG